MVRRVTTEIAAAYAPYTYAILQGLGATQPAPGKWPVGRSYWSTAHFRAPYDEFAYFQDNTLEGLGADSSPSLPAAIQVNAPPEVKRYLLSGEPVSPLRQNVTLPFNQIPRWAYGVAAVGALALAYHSYKQFKKTKTG